MWLNGLTIVPRYRPARIQPRSSSIRDYTAARAVPAGSFIVTHATVRARVIGRTPSDLRIRYTQNCRARWRTPDNTFYGSSARQIPVPYLILAESDERGTSTVNSNVVYCFTMLCIYIFYEVRLECLFRRFRGFNNIILTNKVCRPSRSPFGNGVQHGAFLKIEK